MVFTRYNETFNIKGQNAAQLNAGSYLVIQDQENANKNGNLPHNAFTISNIDTTCTLFIYLDDMTDNVSTPDYVLFPSQQISVSIEDGVSFSSLFIKNTHASSNIAAGNIKYKISTVKEKGY